MTQVATELVIPTHTYTILGFATPDPAMPTTTGGNEDDPHTDLTWEFPNSQEHLPGDVVTALFVNQSNLIPAHNGFGYAMETLHFTGVRYGEVDIQTGHLTLDGRAPATIEGWDVDNHSSGHGVIYALDEETYLVTRWGGAAVENWRYSTVAWVVRVNEAGVPVVVDTHVAFAPSAYNPFLRQLIHLNPTLAWLTSEGIASGLPSELLDPAVLGCWGVPVSPSGFGAQVRYADPSLPSNVYDPTDPGDWGYLGQGFNAETMVLAYAKPSGGSSQNALGLYSLATGQTTDLMVPAADLPLSSSANGAKGDVYAGTNKMLTWWWGGDTISTLAGSTLSIGEPWDKNFFNGSSFESFDPDLTDANGAWSDRTFFGDEEVRFANYQRQAWDRPDPLYSSVADVWNRIPAYQQAYPTVAQLEAAVATYYPSTEAFLAESNQGTSTDVGYYVGFQTGSPTIETTHWAIFDDTTTWPDDFPVMRLLGVSDGPSGRSYYTASQSNPTGAGSVPANSVMIVRWDPFPQTEIDGALDLTRREFWR